MAQPNLQRVPKKREKMVKSSICYKQQFQTHSPAGYNTLELRVWVDWDCRMSQTFPQVLREFVESSTSSSGAALADAETDFLQVSKNLMTTWESINVVEWEFREMCLRVESSIIHEK